MDARNGGKLGRRTSIEALRSITENGLLNERKLQAYQTLFHYGPLTGRGISDKSGIPGLWKRLSELKALGLAHEVGQVLDRVTGQMVTLWDVTDHVLTRKKLNIREIRIKCKACDGKGSILFERRPDPDDVHKLMEDVE